MNLKTKKMLFVVTIIFIICSFFYICYFKINYLKDGNLILINTKIGNVLGIEKDGVKIFKGIYYAEPTTGKNRFAPTVIKQKYPFIINAVKTKPCIPQTGNVKYSENSLTLNILTKTTQKGSKNPVFVFINGGSFLWDSTSDSIELIEGLNIKQTGIVCVSINYRLGFLGFLPLKTTYDIYGTTGNWGIIDIITALKWIKENISEFGGDSDNITICGISSGSAIVSSLISSPKAKNLFSKAVMLSGALHGINLFPKIYDYNLTNQILMASSFIKKFNADDSKNGLKILRKVPVKKIVNIQDDYCYYTNILSSLFAPIPDGNIIPFDYISNLRQGNNNNVKLLMGYSTNDGNIFIEKNYIKNNTYPNILKNLFKQNMQKVLNKFPLNESYSIFDRLGQIYTLAIIRAGMYEYADALSSNNQDVYVYHFNYINPNLKNITSIVSHCSDLKYIFYNDPSEFKKFPKSEKIAKIMNTSLINFIKTGNPNGGEPLPDNIKWEKYSKENPVEMLIQENPQITPVYEKENINFFRELLYGKLE